MIGFVGNKLDLEEKRQVDIAVSFLDDGWKRLIFFTMDHSE